MRQLSTFQIVVLGIFITLAMLGVGVFAVSGGFGSGSNVGTVTIWGTFDASVMESVLATLRQQDKSLRDVVYQKLNSDTYQKDLINAMASGKGPDLVLLPLDMMSAFSDKVLIIPYSSLSQGNFTSSFIDEAQLYLTPDGSLAVPFFVDPLVMYWNRDLFASAGVANPPQYWNDLLNLAPKITSLDGSSNVKRSAVALGTWNNIKHAKEILSALFLQAGDPIISRDTEGNPSVSLGIRSQGDVSNPAESALRFYTEFANPTKTSYSWNKSLPEAADLFSSGDLAIYFGYASEYDTFNKRNPNLRFGVALLPQIEGTSTRATFGVMLGLSIPRSSHNPQGALIIAQKLTSASASTALSQLTGLPSVRRDVSLDTSKSAATSVFVQSGLISRGFLDPSSSDTDAIYKDMIESVISGKLQPSEAVADASEELQQLVAQ